MNKVNKVIRVNNWQAVQIKDSSDYYIYDHRGIPDGCRGLARNEEQAVKWLEDATGITYNNLPPVKRSDIRVQTDEKIPIREFSRRGWYRNTRYFLGDKELGYVQIKNIRHRNTRNGPVQDHISGLVMADGHGGAIVSGDDNLQWILRQNGYRLIEG